MNLVFDIGYNHGKFSSACLLCYPNCKIVAAEANPSLASVEPISSNITILNTLVSSKGGEQIPFFISPEDGISTASLNFISNSRFARGSSHIHQKSQWYHPISIPSVTLDDLISKYGMPDFLKVDVEGYEKEVLSGLSQPVSLLAFEWHEEDYLGMCENIDHLKSLGFSEFSVIGHFEDHIPPFVNSSIAADDYMNFPVDFYTWSLLKKSLDSVIDPSRRVNYGMVYCKANLN